MTSALFSSITTDPGQVLEEKLEEWRKNWKCENASQRDKACRAIRAAIAEALNARTYDGGTTHVHTGSEIAAGAKSFKETTSVGGDNWSLHELARVQQADLDKLGQHLAK